MARNRQPVLKKCRALGIDPVVLGVNKSSKRGPRPNANKKPTEYAVQLREKQKAKFIYNVMEKQFRKIYEEAARKLGVTGLTLIEYLERRLENVVYRLGFAKTRRQARQVVSHGHVAVNGRRVNIASYRVKVGDVISIIENSKNLDIIKTAVEDARVPAWLELDKAAFSGKVLQNPTKDDLDEISTEYPICIIRACGHVCVVNSKALELAGIDKNTVQIEGGQFDIDENNEPNGIFRENALNLIYNKIPKPDKEDIKNMILKACESLNSYGVTSAQTDDFIVFPGVDYEVIINAYKELANEGKLTVKIYEQAQLAQKEELESFLSKGYTTGVGDDYFKIGPLKLLGDGSLGARTAYLNEPYSDDNSTFGICTYTQDQFDEMVELAHKNNMQVAIHAIGDKAMDMVVNSIEKALDKSPRDNHRHGVVHCQLTTSNLLNKFRDLKLHAYIQSIFLDYDINIVEDRIGVDRAKTSYNFNTLFNETTMSNGSDCPVELPNVLNGIYCAVTRKTLNGKGPFLPNQALSVKDAILSFTRNGAYASFEEDAKGDIAVGKAADFVLLSDNLLDIDANKIKDVKVLNTFLDGRCIYSYW